MVSCEDCIHNDVCDYLCPERYVTIQDMKNDCAYCIPTADVVPKRELDNLEYTLIGVMHSVDKWLEGDELKQHEVNRAATMREKTLQIVEGLQKTISAYEETSGLKKAKSEVAREIFAGVKLILQNMADEYGYKASLEPDFDLKKEYRGAQIGVSVALHSIVAYEVELKKKYTEDQT